MPETLGLIPSTAKREGLGGAGGPGMMEESIHVLLCVCQTSIIYHYTGSSLTFVGAWPRLHRHPPPPNLEHLPLFFPQGRLHSQAPSLPLDRMPASESYLSVNSHMGLGLHISEARPMEMVLEPQLWRWPGLLNRAERHVEHTVCPQLVLTKDITSPSLHFYPELLWAVASGSV